MVSEGKPINVYIHRQAATPKSCFVCHKQTPHVLCSQSIPTIDFLYVCLAHLGDRHFATKVSDPPASSSSSTSSPSSSSARLPEKVSQAEIERVKAEWEAKQKEKEKKDKEKKEQEEKDKKEKESKSSSSSSSLSMASSVFSTITSTVSGLASTAMGTSTSSSANPTSETAPPSTAPTTNQYPLHAKYALHREFYAARVREWNAKMVKKKERELNMPPAPKNALR